MGTLFNQALGFSAPWRAVNVDCRLAEGLISFEIDNTAKRLPCPVCGAADQPIHDQVSRTSRHLNHSVKQRRYARRYLVEAAYRFNRRFRLRAFLPRLLRAMVLCAHCPEPLLRRAVNFSN